MSVYSSLDEAGLKSYLNSEFANVDDFSIRGFERGLSPYQIFELDLDGDTYVLRTPHPETSKKFANGIEREYEILSAIKDTTHLSPDPTHYCNDTSVIGREFYLMEFRSGEILGKTEPNWLNSVSKRQDLSRKTIESLASIHDISLRDTSLKSSPEGYTTVEQFIDNWWEYIKIAQQVTAHQQNVDFESVRDWLKRHIPKDGNTTLIHGDFMLDNILVKSDPIPNIHAVLDWELAAVGDPRIDLGWFLLFWYEQTDPESLASDSLPTYTRRDGYPSREELVSTYERCANELSFDLEYFRTLAAFKLASMSEYFYYLYLIEEVDRDMYQTMGQLVPELVDRIQKAINGEITLAV